MKEPKILLYDVETAPILAYVWALFDQNVSLSQIKEDWHLLSWSAKWLGSKTVMYQDQRRVRNISDDSGIVSDLWALLNEADVVITQNGKNFDDKKVNARFLMHGLKPPAPYKNIDVYLLAKRRFGFTSNKLEYMTDKLCTKYKKLKHEKFPGFELWKECLAGNKEAWDEMEKYNKHDVLALEELYQKMAPWETTVNLAVYRGEKTCNCGSKRLQRRGYKYTKTGILQKYCCLECGCWMSRSKDGVMSAVVG